MDSIDSEKELFRHASLHWQITSLRLFHPPSQHPIPISLSLSTRFCTVNKGLIQGDASIRDTSPLSCINRTSVRVYPRILRNRGECSGSRRREGGAGYIGGGDQLFTRLRITEIRISWYILWREAPFCTPFPSSKGEELAEPRFISPRPDDSIPSHVPWNPPRRYPVNPE